MQHPIRSHCQADITQELRSAWPTLMLNGPRNRRPRTTISSKLRASRQNRRPSLGSVRATPQHTERNERAGHVHHTTTASRPRPLQLQLSGTEISWQGLAATAKVALQVSETWPHPRKSLPRQYGHTDHQSGGNKCPVPNNPCWITGDSTPSPDKWALFKV